MAQMTQQRIVQMEDILHESNVIQEEEEGDHQGKGDVTQEEEEEGDHQGTGDESLACTEGTAETMEEVVEDGSSAHSDEEAGNGMEVQEEASDEVAVHTVSVDLPELNVEKVGKRAISSHMNTL